ncbi:hypothetical protein CLAFUW4_12697 [Fulvia fulva]|nr:hypothetical protein CLAFUR4_12702 [Fulvia fulva]WPV21157.1 hypothetical protein CLAFUW4_12697 [Fulvia fulva]
MHNYTRHVDRPGCNHALAQQRTNCTPQVSYGAPTKALISHHGQCQGGTASNSNGSSGGDDCLLPESFQIIPPSQRDSRISRKVRILSHIEHRLGPLSQSASALNSQLLRGEADPFTELESRIKQGTADSEIIRVCLIVAKDRLFSLPRKECSAAGQAGPPYAARTLKYIWSDTRLWNPIACVDNHALFSLSGFSIYENLHDLVLEWARAHVPIEQSEQFLGPDNVWRGYLVRSMLSALNACETGNSADQVLETFFKVKDWKRAALTEQPPGPAMPIGLRPAMFEIFNALTSGVKARTSPALYDRFQRFCLDQIILGHTRNGLQRNQVSLAMARLALHHPTRPDVDPAIDYIRHLLQSKDAGDALVWAMEHVTKKFIEETHRVLERQQRQADCVWVERAFESVFGQTLKAFGQERRQTPRRD